MTDKDVRRILRRALAAQWWPFDPVTAAIYCAIAEALDDWRERA
jgi:hypothetical protein